MKKNQHFLVVGGGVAGIAVSKHLIDQDQHVTLVENGQNKSSTVAAGMINPIVFRRMTKSWRVDEFLPYCNVFYCFFETIAQHQLFCPITIRRFFSSEQERQFWLDKQDQPDFSNYLNSVSTEDLHFSRANNPFGSGRLNGSSYVQTIPFVNAGISWINMNGNVIQENFDFMQFDPFLLQYKQTTYDGVVFCEGVGVVNNPYFKRLPVQHTKGETITVSSEGLKTIESYNRKCFILPQGNDTYRVGATYVWNTLNDKITPEGRKELEEKFQVVTDMAYSVIDQQAGVRPTTPDRRPIVGEHPEFEGLYIFNGLGTKGYMIAPLLAKEFVNQLLNGLPFDPETALNRFKIL